MVEIVLVWFVDFYIYCAFMVAHRTFGQPCTVCSRDTQNSYCGFPILVSASTASVNTTEQNPVLKIRFPLVSRSSPPS